MSNQQQWFVRVANGERGPFSGAQLKAFAAGGKLTPQMQIRRGDITEWFPAGKVTGLFTASGPSATNQRATSADISPGTGAKLLARPLSPAMVVPMAPSATALAILACSLITSGVVSSLIISFVFRGD